MRKSLLSWAFLGALMLGGASASAAELTNLTPNFDFGKAEAPIQFVGQASSSWNLPVNWVKNNVINGNLDATGGALVLSGGDGPINNFPNHYQDLNANLRLVDLGGTCGKVLTINHNNSKLQEVLAADYDITVDLPNHLHPNKWYQQYVYVAVPDPVLMAQYAGKKLRCRVELNIYCNTESSDNAFYAYFKSDQNDIDEADYNVATVNRVKFSDFYTDGKWDATKWMVYEFEFTVPGTTEDIKDWTLAPYLKFETEKNFNSAFMLRNIVVFDPEGVEGLEAIDRTKKNFVTNTVGAAESRTEAIVELWKSAQVADLVGKWTGTDPDWTTPAAIKATSNTRFATAYNGKVYTVDQKTMSIAEVTKEGKLVPTYVLPQPANAKDFYGTAIAVDEVGNFLIGMNFTQRPASSTKWAIYNTATNTCKEFNLAVPEGMTIGRIDCVGRVLGDLTKDAVFTIVPETGDYTSAVRLIAVNGEGTLESVTMTDLGNVSVGGNYTQQNIAQPAYRTMDEAKAANGVNNFYYSSCTGLNNYYASYIGGKVTNNFAPNMLKTSIAGTNGFDTFVADGKRYFVRNWADVAEARTMNIVIMNDEGNEVARWINPDYVLDGGYSSIIAEPLADNTVNIYVFNSGNKYGAVAMLNFDPALAGEPIVPADPVGSKGNPYQIWTAEDLVGMFGKMSADDFYMTLEADIDMTGVAYPANPNNTKANAIYLDGKNHVIKNISFTGDRAAMFSNFHGRIANIGLENVNAVGGKWDLAAPYVAYVLGNAELENCYATGSASSNFAGGLIAGVQANSNVTITNCYSTVDVTSSANNGGGLVGGINGKANITITNSYAAGTIKGDNHVGGLVAAFQAAVDETSVVTIKNAAVFCPSISGKTNVDAVIGNKNGATVNVENVYISDETKVNGEAVADAVAKDEIVATVQTWAGYNASAVNVATGLPIFSWQSGLQAGMTEDYPVVISTAADLAAIKGKLIAGAFTYIVIDNDIDMSGVTYNANNQPTTANVYIDGKNHVIKNLTINAPFGALFAIMNGSVKNLGFENVDLTCGGWGGAGAIAGYIGVNSPTTVENCYVTGKLQGVAGQLGSFACGARDAGATISNCYSTAVLTSNGQGMQGGLIGAVMYAADKESVLNINNSYFAGSIVNGGLAGGLVGANQTYLHPETGTEVLNFKDCAVLSASINGGEATANAIANQASTTLTINTENVMIGDGVKVNNTVVEGAVDEASIVKAVMAWEAFNSTEVNETTELPILAWQSGKQLDTSAVVEVEANEEVPAVYYNLQGVEVAKPESGIYIVRRGNKVTKELVK